MTRARAQRIARGEEEELNESDDNDNTIDDDVFSAFGDEEEEEEGDQLMMMTQEGISTSGPESNNDDGGANNDDEAVSTTTTFSPAVESTNDNNDDDGDDNNDTVQVPPQQQQEQQLEAPFLNHQEEDQNAAMQEFFQHVVPPRDDDESSSKQTLTYSEWEGQRKQFLKEYLNHRLIGVDTTADADNEDTTMEESSFHSGVLDEAFENENGEDNPNTATTAAAAAAAAENQEEESEGEEPLQTQQQLETQEIGLFSGIKRKLGFLSQSQENEQQDDEGNEDTDDQDADSTHRNNNNNKRQKGIKRARMTPGQMWDGNLSSIPHVSETTSLLQDNNSNGGKCFHVKEMDLYSSSVNLGLCRVVRVWGNRLTRRINKLKDEEMMLVDNHSGDEFSSYENDGPLNMIYKNVFSIEVVQLDNGNEDNIPTTSSPIPAFCNPLTNHKSASRQRRHEVRRARIFFYNKYATVMDAIFDQVSNDFKKTGTPVLVSLVNVPPECIMPLSMSATSNPHLQQYVNNPFGDEELGVSSPYCICIGDESLQVIVGDDKKEKAHFDGEGRGAALEIRLVEFPLDLSIGTYLPLDDDVAGGITINDFIVSATSIRSGKRYSNDVESILSRRYLQLVKRQKEQGEIEFQATVFNAEEYDVAASGARNDVQNVGVAGLRGTIATACGGDDSNVAAAGEEANAENSDPNTNSASTSAVVIDRPRFVASLGSLPAILNHGRRDAITVYGVVLGFSPPRITRMNTYMMSIVLIDETIPTSREVGAGNETELHVPSITLNLFAKDKSELPPVRSAGDVICCQKVLLQEYNNEPQLRAKKNSNIIVVRPSETRSFEGTLQDSTSPDDWSLSDGRYEVDLDLTNSLWRWGQRRLSTHPTMSPNCYIAISQVSDHVDNFEVSVSGDITAVVTSILPTPEHLRRRDTPRGFLRLWDGTGPSRSDPMPNNVVNASAGQSIADPPEQVLVRIEKILKAISSAEHPDTTYAGVKAPLALCGRVINAIIWEEDLWNLIQRDGIINIGSFIRLRNINNAMLPSGIRVNCLSVHAKSSLTPLPHDAYEVKMLLKGHDTRLKRGVPTNPTSAILPSESAPRPQFSTREAAISGFSMLDDCLRKPAPATFTVQFEVSHTLPASNLNSIDTLKSFCVKQRNGSAVFRFAIHIKDASAEVDVICHGKVAEDLLGISAQEVPTSAAKCTQALATLKEYISSGSVCEGKIRSVMGKDKRVYFILCSMFCITS